MMAKKNEGIYGLVVIALVIFSLNDLAISERLYYPGNSLGLFFEAFGEFPMALIGCFSAAALIVTSGKKKTLANAGLVILFLFNGLIAAYLPGLHLKLPMPMIVAMFLIFSGGSAWLATLVNVSRHDNLRKVAKVGLILSLAPILIINIIKMIWGRPRYRSMLDPALEFTPWYSPQGFTTNNEFMSFPSGHAANATVLLWITLLPLVWDKLKRMPLEICAWIWVLCVMVSRITVGAHFASDVTMGMAITFSLFLLLKKKYIGEN